MNLRDHRLATLLATCLTLASTACAEDIGFDDEAGTGEGTEGEDEGADEGGAEDPVTHTEEPPYTRTVVDATDESAWIYLDLDAVETVDEDGPWDVAFLRFNVALNGGVSGSGGVEAAIVEGIGLEDYTALEPDAAFITDEPDSDEDDNDDPEYAFGGWYDYDFMTHVLSPKLQVYVVRSTEGALFAVQIEDYYSEAGTSGYMDFRWLAVEG